MTDPDWSRPHWDRAAAKAMLVYFVFGAFVPELQLDPSAHGSRGLPREIETRRIPKAMLAHWDGHPLRGALGETLRDDNQGAFAAAREAPECLLLRGELPDPDSLGYLRDTLGVIDALLDAGGVAVVDPQILEVFSAAGWRARYAGAARAAPRNHVAILCNDDAKTPPNQWVHSRGMRKFARPDVSIRGVPRTDVQRAGAVATRLAELQARGMRFGDGSTVDVEGVPGGLHVLRAGSLDDPRFNNVHLDVTWPGSVPAR